MMPQEAECVVCSLCTCGSQFCVQCLYVKT